MERYYKEFVRWRRSVDDALDKMHVKPKKSVAYFYGDTQQIILHEALNTVLLDEENSLNSLFGEIYEEKSKEDVFESERNDCLKAVKVALQKCANKKRAFEKQIKAGEKHELFSLEADAIMAYASAYKKNEEYVRGFDFETGEPKNFKNLESLNITSKL